MAAFEELLASLERLQKALPGDDQQDDEKISDMADGDADGDGTPDGEEYQESDGDEDEDAGDENDEDESESFGKSFAVTLSDGSQVEAYDGTAMIKSLQVELGHAHAALAQSIDLTKSLFAEINGLKKSVAALQGQGKGRKAVLSIHDKPTLGKAENSTVRPQDLLAKALTAQRDGKITSVEVAQIDTYLGRNANPPSALLAKIV